MKTTRLFTLFNAALAASLLFSLAACKTTPKKGDNGQYGGGASESDTVNGTPLPDRQEGVSFTSDNVDRNQFKPVHFAFDSYAINPDDQPTLDQVADFMKGGANVIVAGFTDERGTAEYNRGLGEKRAEAVRGYLIQRGADGGKIQTVSFGAEMPVDPESNESAWGKNRRAEFGVVK